MIVKSKYKDVDIPVVSLPQFLLQRTSSFGDRPALIDGPSGRSFSYAEFGKLTRNVAANLAQRGFGPGDRFAIYSPNYPEYAIAFMGIVLAGGTVTTINPLYTQHELAIQLKDSAACYLLTTDQFCENAIAAAQRSDVKEVFSLGSSSATTPFADLLKDNPNDPDITVDPHQDLVVIPYSSGTTGLSKGVMLTHFNLVANIVQIHGMSDYKATTTDDVVMGVLPFYHIYGMVVIMITAMINGTPIVTMPRFDMEQFLSLIQKYRATRAALVPPIIVGLTKHPAVDQYDLSSLEYINSGAAPLGNDVSLACAERIGCHITQGYGLTETSPVTHTNPYVPEKIKHGSVGLALPNTETKIVDLESGVSVGKNIKGEIYIRGPQVMKGYLNNSAATKGTIDSEGWLHTGDIGYIDDGDYLFVVDRLKELIKYKGFQVAPAELEDLLLTMPEITDAAVIPVPDDEAGEMPKAFVVLNSKISEAEIMKYVSERVAPYKKIRVVEVCQEIPKSLSGKILRRVLVERERALQAKA